MRVCEKLGLTSIPRLYVLQSGGALNAFATKFSGRDFVVVNSDLLEAFGPDSPEMEFILGHELGHLKSNHIFKRVFMSPGILLPLIGPAYLRACEASCDRYGAFAASDLQGATRALLALGGGKAQGRILDADAFAGQHTEERGFFVSWHELSSAYPTLSQRVARMLALTNPRFDTKPKRHPLAYVLALFTPGGRAASDGANALVFVVIIGVLAAIAIPAFQNVRTAANERNQMSTNEQTCRSNEREIAAAVQQYTLDAGKAPLSPGDFSGPGKIMPAFPTCPSEGEYQIAPKATERSKSPARCMANRRIEVQVSDQTKGRGRMPPKGSPLGFDRTTRLSWQYRRPNKTPFRPRHSADGGKRDALVKDARSGIRGGAGHEH